MFFIFTPTWERFPIWQAYISDGLKPPTSAVFNSLPVGGWQVEPNFLLAYFFSAIPFLTKIEVVPKMENPSPIEAVWIELMDTGIPHPLKQLYIRYQVYLHVRYLKCLLIFCFAVFYSDLQPPSMGCNVFEVQPRVRKALTKKSFKELQQRGATKKGAKRWVQLILVKL